MTPPALMLLLGIAVLWGQFVAISPQCLAEGDSSFPISEKARQQLLKGQLQFSANLIKTVSKTQTAENIFFSPSSVFSALLLAYFVSANQTEAGLRTTLQLEDQKKRETLGAYSLEKYCKQMRSIKASLNYQLASANRMYVSNQEKIRPCAKKLLKEDIEVVDFTKNVTDTITRINKWVSAETRGNINSLLSGDSVNANTKLVLVNAAYFKGIWKHQFPPANTRVMNFTLANGTEVPTMMMSVEGGFSHKLLEDLDVEVLELRYEGDDIAMFFLLPEDPSPSAITDLINKIDAGAVHRITNTSGTDLDDVTIVIPKFKVDESLQMKNILESMGVGDLFKPSANLSSLTGSDGIRLDSIIHKAKINVDETGTEAAAATAIFANRFASDNFVADHPFVYFVYDKMENIILFFGVYNNPEN